MGFLAALQFLTIVPPLVRRPFTGAELGRATAWFPAIGLLLGGLLWALDERIRSIWPGPINAALVLLVWVLATGALHLDGFLDTCDGLFGGHTPEDRLRIMRDHHVGSFAVVGGILLLLLKVAAIAAIGDRQAALFLAPVLARLGIVLGIFFFPYARPEGLGRAMKDHIRWFDIAQALLIAAAASWFFAAERGLFVLAIAVAGTWVAARFVLLRLPGLTGDTYGAICEALEVVVLLFFAVKEPA